MRPLYRFLKGKAHVLSRGEHSQQQLISHDIPMQNMSIRKTTEIHVLQGGSIDMGRDKTVE